MNDIEISLEVYDPLPSKQQKTLREFCDSSPSKKNNGA
jgi:hypothetical protein